VSDFFLDLDTIALDPDKYFFLMSYLGYALELSLHHLNAYDNLEVYLLFLNIFYLSMCFI